MKEAGEQTIEIDLPVKFLLACEICGVKPEAAVRYFVDNLYTFAAATNSVFTDQFPILEVVRNFSEHPSAAPFQDQIEPINQKYFEKMKYMIVKNFGKKNFLKLHSKIISEWYDALQSKKKR